MLQTHPSSPLEQGLVRPALISIAGQWKSAAGRHGWGAQTLQQRGFVSLRLGGIPSRDLLSGSHQCPQLLRGGRGPQRLRALSAASGCTEEVTLCSRCCCVSTWARQERGRWLFASFLSSKAMSSLSSQACSEPPSPNLTCGQPSHLTTVQFLWSGCCCKGPRNQLINRNQDPRV